MRGKLLPALAAGFWIAGLVLGIVGLNIHSDAGSWLSVTGNILFFLGLALEGVFWVRRRGESSGKEKGQENESSV